jgi:lipopolysaccharide/colanic/teichoic acid biosynthesis glycosyltransferase
MANRQIDPQERFLIRIAQEWRRAERSGRPSLLVLFDGLDQRPKTRDSFLNSLSSTFRDTDVFGWFKTNATFGVIFLELGRSSVSEARDAILNKVRAHVLCNEDPFRSKVGVTVHVIPPYSGGGAIDGSDAELGKTLWNTVSERDWVSSAIKRGLDLCGSLFLLVTLFPMLLAIAAWIRITSPGPALFRQDRTGLGGRPFGLYKFRTMKVGNDAGLHLDYVKRFISGEAERNLDESGQPVFKLTCDPRVTRFGRFLRRTSLDELPQLWNVVRGEMSLVGPRPALPYEVECYGLWHRRRVYELKPGLTGLWQVRGRSRCNFDEMIRLDLQHAQPHSLGLYVQVLMETPRAVIQGHGAH